MRATSDAVPYEQQNLWIIDERLSYHCFLASDMPLDSVSVLASGSESRPDIMIFDWDTLFRGRRRSIEFACRR